MTYLSNIYLLQVILGLKNPKIFIKRQGKKLDHAIEENLRSLTQNEERTIRYRFADSMPLEGIARIIGVSKERVRQIEAKAIRKMRARSNPRIQFFKKMKELLKLKIYR